MKSLSTTPLVSIVILNWNGLRDTKLCLEYVRKQTYSNFETIVVDNGSRDHSVAYLEKQKDIVLVKNTVNRGFTGGHIDGLRHAKGDFILLLNNDAVMKPNLIEEAMKNFADESVAVIGGRAYQWNKDNPLLDESNAFYSYQFVNSVTAEAIFYQKDYGVTEEVNNVSGSCVLVRRSVIERVGYLEDRFFAYYEESDLFARIKRAGYKVLYDPKVRIWHKVGASSARKSSSFMYYMLFKNRFYFAVRNFQKGYLRKFLYAYTAFGIKSMVKSVIRRGDQIINKSFTKAFFHNLVFGHRSFSERRTLKKQLGISNYNNQILIEQANVSHVVVANAKADIELLFVLSKHLRPSHELVIVTDTPYGGKKVLPHNVRICVNKGYFSTHPENYGAVVSRYDWVCFTKKDALASSFYYEIVDKDVGWLLSTQKKCAILTDSETLSPDSPLVLTDRQLFIDIHGFNSSRSLTFNLALLLSYAHTTNTLYSRTDTWHDDIKQLGISAAEQKKAEALAIRRHEAIEDQVSRFYDPLFARYYRLDQLRTVLHWIISPRIKLRLKLARLRNLFIFTFRLKKKELATEIKHMKNGLSSRINFHVPSIDEKRVSKEAFARQSNKPSETSVFIICRDRLSPLLEIVAWLEKAGVKKIIFIDNDSTFPDLVDYLKKTKYQVFDMKRNTGHTVAWQQSIIPIFVPTEYYIVTDPDVIPASSPATTVQYLYKVHNQYPNHLKVGLGLKIDDLPDHYSLKESVIQWESQFWTQPIAPNIYEAGVDTTFALYKPFVYEYSIHPSLRLGEPYTAYHLPWYTDDSKLTNEDLYYRLRADQNVNTWNKGELPERYVKELTKQSRSR